MIKPNGQWITVCLVSVSFLFKNEVPALGENFIFKKENHLNQLKSYPLAIRFYHSITAVKLPYGLTSQLRRASSSIALNLAEGSGRRTRQDRLRFYSIALGSIRECQAIIDLESNRFNEEQRDLIDHLGASVYKLVNCRSGGG